MDGVIVFGLFLENLNKSHHWVCEVTRFVFVKVRVEEDLLVGGGESNERHVLEKSFGDDDFIHSLEKIDFFLGEGGGVTEIDIG